MMLRFALISGLKKMVYKSRLQVNLLDILIICFISSHLWCHRSFFDSCFLLCGCCYIFFFFFLILTKVIFCGFSQLDNIVHFPPVGLNAAFVLFAVTIQDVLSPQ